MDAQRLTVLQVLPRLEVGGVERGTVDLVQGLTAANIQAIVVSGGGQLVGDILKAKGLHLQLPVYSKNPLRILHNAYSLYRLIKEHSVSIIHCRSRAPAWSSWIAAKWAKIPFVTTIHGAYKTKPVFKKWYNNAMMKADKIIAISGYIESYIQQVAPKITNKICLIYRGVDCDYFNPKTVSPQRLETLTKQWELKPGLPLILCPARLTRLKNHVFLIQALKEVTALPFQCVIVGKGTANYIQELKNLIVSVGLQEKIYIKENCTDMPAAYLLADVVVQTANHPEAFGRVIAEAQAMGKPVLAPNKAGPQEIVILGKTGWLYEPNNKQSFLMHLKKIWALGQNNKNKLAEQTRANIIKNFDKKQMINATIAVYRQLIH